MAQLRSSEDGLILPYSFACYALLVVPGLTLSSLPLIQEIENADQEADGAGC